MDSLRQVGIALIATAAIGVAIAADNSASQLEGGEPSIAFTRVDIDGADLASLDSRRPDGARPFFLHPATDADPSASPDGRRLAFVSDRAGLLRREDLEVFVMDAEALRQRPVTANRAYDGEPAWSPAGGRIAFASDRDGNLEIYSMGEDGGGVVRLTRDDASDSQPTWAPDGQTLAFTSDRLDGRSQVFLMNADGTDQRPLSPSPGTAESHPAVSPDGRSVALLRPVAGAGYDAWVVEVAGGVARRLTEGGELAPSAPAWAPDGSALALAHKQGHLVTTSSSGGRLSRLGSFPGGGSSVALDPVWLPSRRAALRGSTGPPVPLAPAAAWQSVPASFPKQRCTKLGDNGRDGLVGRRVGDVLCGMGGRDTLVGFGGADRLRGGSGDDTIAGGRGKDRVVGGSGSDTIDVQSGGVDRVIGGPGRDVAFADASDRVVGARRRTR